MSGSSSEFMLECQVCNWRIAEKNLNICLACFKFATRNRSKTLLCRSGSNNCQMSTRHTTSIVFCQKCRLQKCFASIEEGRGDEGDFNEEMTKFSLMLPIFFNKGKLPMDGLEEGAEESIENFETTWMHWLSSGNYECLTLMISETIYQFSQRIPNFSLLSQNIQLMLNFQATPLLCLILALASNIEQLTVDFIYQLFPALNSFNGEGHHILIQFNKWQPSPLEIGCLMAVIIFRYCGENDDISIGNVLHSIDTSLSTINQSGRKAHFIDILSAILPISYICFRSENKTEALNVDIIDNIAIG